MPNPLTIRQWRRGFRLLLLIAVASCACRNESHEVRRIGVICGIPFFHSTLEAFQQQLAELGYREGREITYIIHDSHLAGGDHANDERAARRLAEQDLDLIVAYPTEVSLLAKQAAHATGVPVLFCHAFIESTGLVDSVREPGPGITGVRFPGPDIAVKRLELLMELVPSVRRVWIPVMDGYPSIAPQRDVLEAYARPAGIALVWAPVPSAAELRPVAYAAIDGANGFDAILLICDPVGADPLTHTLCAELASRNLIPVCGYVAEGPANFGLCDVSQEPNESVGGQLAVMAATILRGTPPGSMPVESTRTVMRINCKVADALGIVMPAGPLHRADFVIR